MRESRFGEPVVQYREFIIEPNYYGRGWTIAVDGDDLWFETVAEAKKFIDEITD